MLRRLAVLALAVGLVGCGGEVEERQILIDYVGKMRQLDGKNEQIVTTIEHLRKPISEISEHSHIPRYIITAERPETETAPHPLGDPLREHESGVRSLGVRSFVGVH